MVNVLIVQLSYVLRLSYLIRVKCVPGHLSLDLIKGMKYHVPDLSKNKGRIVCMYLVYILTLIHLYHFRYLYVKDFGSA
jgi:hypothetical protein